MGFKEWPAWLKGGVILSGIYLLVIAISTIVYSLIKTGSSFDYSSILLMIPMAPGLILLGSLRFPLFQTENAGILPYVVSFFISLVIYFLIGALIGWIVGKFKSKKGVKK